MNEKLQLIIGKHVITCRLRILEDTQNLLPEGVRANAFLMNLTFMGVALGDVMSIPAGMWSSQCIEKYFGRIKGFLPEADENAKSKEVFLPPQKKYHLQCLSSIELKFKRKRKVNLLIIQYLHLKLLGETPTTFLNCFVKVKGSGNPSSIEISLILFLVSINNDFALFIRL